MCGPGIYEATYVQSVAGEVQLVVQLGGGREKAAFRALCVPARVAPAKCEVQHSSSAITAGATGQLCFWTRDRCSAHITCSIWGAFICARLVYGT